MTPADALGSRPAASHAWSNNAKLIFSKQVVSAKLCGVSNGPVKTYQGGNG
jgi:hypothetical protein